MNKAISLILIILLILVLPVLSVAQTASQLHHGVDTVTSDTHHDDHRDNGSHQREHRCCHAHVSILALPVSVEQTSYFSLRKQHGTEYRFVVASSPVFPELRPPIV